MKDEVIQEAYDLKCEHLYFVLEGQLKVEAQVTVEQEVKYPISQKQWELQTKKYLVTYMIKELRPGDFFGLEELVKIGFLKLEGKNKKIKKVRRQLKVTAMKNSKLLYLTGSDFHKMFGELELMKLKKFTEEYDLQFIKQKIIESWKHKKKSHKHMTDLTKQKSSKMMDKWLNFAH